MTLERTYIAPNVKPKNAPPIDERMSSDDKPNAGVASIVGRVAGYLIDCIDSCERRR